jgi:outer membrane lipoprotein-sorting protein
MLRRLLALGAALVLVILIVLGVKGCLDARARSALSDYSSNVEQIVNETQQTSKAFFGKLEDPGNLSVKDFVTEVGAESSAMANYASRIDGLSAPGDMGSAQKALELSYELRQNGMETIAKKVPTALGAAGAPKAIASIAKQMQTLLASDVIYENVARPEINGVLADNSIEGKDVPKSSFLPDTKWLEESEIEAALGAVSGSEGAGATTSGIHGLGLIGTSVNGSELSSETTTSVAVEETPEVEVTVQNQGESTENSVTVKVIANGKETTADSNPIEAGAEETVVIPLTPAPTPGVETTLEVEAEPVPGEKVTTNNEATYSVIFE